MHDVIIRTASLADANQVAEVYLASRKAFLSYEPLQRFPVEFTTASRGVKRYNP